jgi:iron(III) transport system permease protein
VYLRIPLPIYGSLWILLVCFVTRYLPYGMRYAGAAMAQLSAEHEESAMVSGASWGAMFRRIVLPLASQGIVAGWVYVLIVTFRELSSALLLYTPGNEVLSVLVYEEFDKGNFTVVATTGVLTVGILVVLVLIAVRVSGRVGIRQER